MTQMNYMIFYTINIRLLRSHNCTYTWILSWVINLRFYKLTMYHFDELRRPQFLIEVVIQLRKKLCKKFWRYTKILRLSILSNGKHPYKANNFSGLCPSSSSFIIISFIFDLLISGVLIGYITFTIDRTKFR